ncbi:hypothetical protein [Desulfovibrio ferrophilus]|uniref:Kinesin-like protein KIF20A n=1 Tax=Desulfovibrio ferrophilus TaxID=241368 RepID=A0A2Z6AZ45_9BACT|nr:hypothetical protein [Desulfovibrio ferrophilus]BBD08426.1 Kinesin-like protein KIF20A [Desulfovibrio ferrophilus]
MLVDTYRLPIVPPVATPETAEPARAVIVAEDKHGRLVERQLELEPDLPSFVRLLADLRRCGYRGIVLRKVAS